MIWACSRETRGSAITRSRSVLRPMVNGVRDIGRLRSSCPCTTTSDGNAVGATAVAGEKEFEMIPEVAGICALSSHIWRGFHAGLLRLRRLQWKHGLLVDP